MRRKVAASILLALASAITFPLVFQHMVGPSVPVPLQGMFMVCIGWWMVLVITSLLRSISRPGDDLRRSKPPRSP